jgi:hypothetical protein
MVLWQRTNNIFTFPYIMKNYILLPMTTRMHTSNEWKTRDGTNNFASGCHHGGKTGRPRVRRMKGITDAMPERRMEGQ